MKFPSLSSVRWMCAVVLAFGSLLAFGWGEGIWTGRWQPSDAGRLAAAKLKDVPMQIGAWEGAD
uniref:hypothetical protein n=1 Tax=Klebsiella pneumoniae TaxID=573 RepID=UPI003B97FD33